MAIADIFLKVQGVTGEATDPEHKGEIEVVSWSWGMDAPVSGIGGKAAGMIAVSELHVVKRVDQSSATLMSFLRGRKSVPTGQLTVRKAGGTPLPYLKIELENVRVNGVKIESHAAELVENVRLGFSKVRVTYTPQSQTGGRGGGSNVFETDSDLGE